MVKLDATLKINSKMSTNSKKQSLEIIKRKYTYIIVFLH